MMMDSSSYLSFTFLRSQEAMASRILFEGIFSQFSISLFSFNRPIFPHQNLMVKSF
jgi:hypothetical protein